MSKYLFETEFEINAAGHLVFPYLSTEAGLRDWFAEGVHFKKNRIINFVWNDKDYKAKIVSLRPEHLVRYQMLSETSEDEKDPAFFEFRIEYSELTQTTFLRIRDYSEMDDEEELQELWNNMIYSLRAALGA